MKEKWLKEFKKSAILILDKKVARLFIKEDSFVSNYKYFDYPGVKMIKGELGYLFIKPRFIRIIQKDKSI